MRAGTLRVLLEDFEVPALPASLVYPDARLVSSRPGPVGPTDQPSRLLGDALIELGVRGLVPADGRRSRG